MMVAGPEITEKLTGRPKLLVAAKGMGLTP